MERRLFHRLDARVLRVSGPDARSWLQGQVTADLRRLADGPVYSLVLTPGGKIVSDAWVTPNREDLLVVLPTGAASSALERLERFLVMEDVTLEMVESEVLHIVGEPQPSGDAWPTNRLGRPGWDWIVAQRALLPENEGWEEMERSAWERTRIEARVPRWGVDFGLDTLPQEAGLLHAVSFEKGCYIGQEPVVMLRDRGKPPKRLVAVRLPNTTETEIRAAGRPAGRITSRAGELGLALIKRKALEASELEIGGQPLEVLAVVGDAP